MDTCKKIVSLGEILCIRPKLSDVVVTNGVFDLLGAHHVSYLESCRSLGSSLIVGINSDAAVKVLKGASRPVVNQDDRARILAGLESVSYVVIFDATNASLFLDAVYPDIYAKAEDYNLDNMNKEELSVLKSYNSKIQFVPLIPNKSTTNTIKTVITKNECPK